MLKKALCLLWISSILSVDVLFIIFFSSQKYKIVWVLCIFSASEVVHGVVDTNNLSEEEVKKTGWQDELPESDEMESKRNTAE